MYQAHILIFTTQDGHPELNKTDWVESRLDAVKKHHKSVYEIAITSQILSYECSKKLFFIDIMQLYEVVLGLKWSRKLVQSTPIGPG